MTAANAKENEMNDAAPAPKPLPAGEYAIVELMGHTTLVGRIAEVEKFGVKMLAIEPLFNDELLPVVFQGGPAIYRLTPCEPEHARQYQPRRPYQLPDAIRAIVPPLLLEASEKSSADIYDLSDDDDDRPF